MTAITTKTFTKDPNARLEYTFDWSKWLTNEDEIESYELLLAEGEEDIVIDDSSADATTVTVWLTGGVDETDYPLTCRITTVLGRIDDRTAVFLCREK
jgi:hypothetical protein